MTSYAFSCLSASYRHKAQCEAVAAATPSGDKEVIRAILSAVEKQPPAVEIDMNKELASLGLLPFFPEPAFPPALAVSSCLRCLCAWSFSLLAYADQQARDQGGGA